VQYTKFKSGLL